MVSGATVAFGAIGDSGQVTTCVNNSKGTWRVITTGSCKSSETLVQLYTKSGADAAFLTQLAADGRYLGLHATADNSDKLDGMDSTPFVTGFHRETTFTGPVAIGAGRRSLLFMTCTSGSGVSGGFQQEGSEGDFALTQMRPDGANFLIAVTNISGLDLPAVVIDYYVVCTGP